ncbi:MAG: ribonuclease III domain-containing protein [Candidatus Andersenbacteria bacterium]
MRTGPTNENPGFALGHNERLEFLGDAVLELVVTEYLYANYPNPEGDLTNWRSSIVNSRKLAEIGKRLGLERFRTSRAARPWDTKPRPRVHPGQRL